jgi:hypothetical protein
MTTKQFIDSLFEQIFTSFNKIEFVNYKYDVLSNTHFVLVPSYVYDSKEFNDFDFDVTTRAFAEGIQGMICFITKNNSDISYEFETVFNSFNNDAILRNLGQFVELKEFFRSDVLKPQEVSFLDVQKGWENVNIAGESNYALAA